jgi:large subunit ribosomal protein L1
MAVAGSLAPRKEQSMAKHSKRYRAWQEKIDRVKIYNLEEAITLIKNEPPVKFDAGVELHVRTEIDVKDGAQQIRGLVSLPHGTGKKIRIWAICENPPAALSAGAERAGGEELIKELASGQTDFDVLVAEPKLMPKLAPLAKTLGPRGLMPSPKSGTVSADAAKTVKELASGKISFKNDDTGNIHLLVGRASFTPEQLQENIQAAFAAVKASRPPAVKGSFIKSAIICTSMGPGIKIQM